MDQMTSSGDQQVAFDTKPNHQHGHQSKNMKDETLTSEHALAVKGRRCTWEPDCGPRLFVHSYARLVWATTEAVSLDPSTCSAPKHPQFHLGLTGTELD